MLNQSYIDCISGIFDNKDSSYMEFIKKIEELKNEKNILIYGAGGWGERLEKLLKGFSIPVKAFIDKKASQIINIEDAPVYFPNNELCDKFGIDETIIIIATRIEVQPAIMNHLKELGYKKIITINGLWYYNCWKNEEELINVEMRKQEILECMDLWTDKISIELYIKNIQCYITRKYVSNIKTELENQYFPNDISLNKGYDVFVDCGAYNGDTISDLNKIKGKINNLIAFEPDLKNFKELKDNVEDKKDKIADNIFLFPCGVWSKTEQLRFVSEKGADSIISNKGISVIQCVSLDDVLLNIKPTFIKMDIEGAEVEALLGAEKLIKLHKPDLAICVYHDINHLWQIPLLLNKWNLGYKFYLRSYEHYNQETVMYATCEE